jgi:hypothetical protein
MKTVSEGSYSSAMYKPYLCQIYGRQCAVVLSGTKNNPNRLFYACYCTNDDDDNIFRAWCDKVNFNARRDEVNFNARRDKVNLKTFHVKQQHRRYGDTIKFGFLAIIVLQMLLCIFIVIYVGNYNCYNK